MRYGKRPGKVKDWSTEEFDEAFIIWQGEGEYRQTEADIKRSMKERGKTEDSYLLGRDVNFWKKFVVDGVIDEVKLKARFKPHQLEELKAEIVRRGWGCLGE